MNSDLTGGLVPAELSQEKARSEEIAWKGEIQVKTTFPTLPFC